jgi:hypothetical protein
LNNRFKEIKDLETDAIFSIADDVIFPCPLVEFAFDVWQSAPDAMVGFVPRVHWVDSLVCMVFIYFLLGDCTLSFIIWSQNISFIPMLLELKHEIKRMTN